MIVIANKTEIRLRDDLQKLAKSKPNQRCFYLALSKTDIPKEQLFETFLRILDDIPNSYMARVYMCLDKDILIMMQGFMQRQFLDFVKTLNDSLQIENIQELIDIYEVAPHWDELKNLYEDKIKKYAHILDSIKEEERKKISDEAVEKAISSIDSYMIKNLPARRNIREIPAIMIADDDQLSRTLAGNVMRGDYETVYAANGFEAIRQYVERAPDVLFLDIGMPDINGHEVLEAIFKFDPEAYIIMFSGRKDKTNIMRALQAGAEGFLGKPFSHDELAEHVRNSPFVQIKQAAAA